MRQTSNRDGRIFALASENVRCNLAFFPNSTHKCIAGHASTFKIKQIPP